MKIFIDSANTDSIRRFLDMGIVDGVTTNPSLVAKEARAGRNPAEQIREIISIVPGPVSVEVVSKHNDGMLAEARRIARLGSNAVVKIPMTECGMRIVRKLSFEGIKTNVTLVFSASQALIAAKAGATYVSPFIGRLEDSGEDGMKLIRDIVQIFRNYAMGCEVLAASIRSVAHAAEAAKAGADVATLPPGIIEEMLVHPLTDAGLRKFAEDWESLGKEFTGSWAFSRAQHEAVE